MRILGIDYGSKRVGIAISDESGLIAHPRGIIENTGSFYGVTTGVMSEILELVQEEKVDRIVVGLPKKMNDTIGVKANEVLSFVEQLKAVVNIPVEVWDERLSSRQAAGLLADAGLSRQKKREHLNTVAAQLILQNYLDTTRDKQVFLDPEESRDDPSDTEPSGRMWNPNG